MADFDEIWCRDGTYDREFCRSKVKVKHNKNTYQLSFRITTFVGGNALAECPSCLRLNSKLNEFTSVSRKFQIFCPCTAAMNIKIQ